MSAILSQQALRELVAEWITQGKRVAGPRQAKPGCVLYGSLESSSQLALEGFIRPANSIKEFIFPKHEQLYGYQIKGNGVEFREVEQPAGELVVLAARPCDAAALPILDHVFNWDYKDELYNRRRQSASIVTLACTAHDDACFCTSVGLGPAAERGSDAMLVDLGGGEYEVRLLTEKGKALFDGKLQASERVAGIPPGPEKRFDAKQVRTFVEEHFESSFWPSQTLACLGCGACAYTCPTCHCFDIVDEGNIERGVRARNWDSCQFTLFTLHASGHNPRATSLRGSARGLTTSSAFIPKNSGRFSVPGAGTVRATARWGWVY